LVSDSKKKVFDNFKFFQKIQTLSIFDFLVKIKTTPSHSYLCLSSYPALPPGGMTAWLAVLFMKNMFFFGKRPQKKVFDNF